MQWISGRLPVPHILHYEKQGGEEFLLLSEIKGKDAKNASLMKEHPVKFGQIMAETLLSVHQLNILDCLFDASLDKKLAKAKMRVEMGLVDSDDFDPERRHQTAIELLREAECNRPDESLDDRVFTHGDYTPANNMLHENKVTGIIDWGRAGAADRHQDIALMLRSLRRHAGLAAANSFIDTYGRHKIDFSKLDYYILLDELF